MITKEQLKHIDADSLLFHMKLLETIGSIEQRILSAYANGVSHVTVQIEHRFTDIAEEELTEGEYVFTKPVTGTDPTDIDEYKITII